MKNNMKAMCMRGAIFLCGIMFAASDNALAVCVPNESGRYVCSVNGLHWMCRDCEGGVEIVGVDGNIPTDLVIPNEVAGRRVVAIGDYALNRSSCGKMDRTVLDGVETLNLNDGLQRIGRGAFEGCLFKSIVVPGGLTEVSSFAFYNCKNLASVSLGKGVCVLKECSFGGCTSLRSILLPPSVERMERAVFEGCTNLVEVVFLGPRPSLLSSVTYDEQRDNIFHRIPDGLSIYITDGAGWKDESGNTLEFWSGRPIKLLKNER